jgi:hypothetical protein
MKNATIIKKARVLATGKIINARWDGIHCIWRDNDHRGTYIKTELEFIKRKRITHN